MLGLGIVFLSGAVCELQSSCPTHKTESHNWKDTAGSINLYFCYTLFFIQQCLIFGLRLNVLNYFNQIVLKTIASRAAHTVWSSEYPRPGILNPRIRVPLQLLKLVKSSIYFKIVLLEKLNYLNLWKRFGSKERVALLFCPFNKSLLLITYRLLWISLSSWFLATVV